MTPIDRGVGLVVAVAASAGIVWASNAPLAQHADSSALLRLSWRARAERIENCRPQSEEALEKLPAHMRQALICDGITASYHLEVRRAGVVVADQIVRGGGLRHDRPLYVFREIPMPAGDASIAVRFSRVDDQTTGNGNRQDLRVPSDAGASAARATDAMNAESRRREDENRRRQLAETVPAALSLEGQFHFAPREVVLVTYDPERRELRSVRKP